MIYAILLRLCFKNKNLYWKVFLWIWTLVECKFFLFILLVKFWSLGIFWSKNWKTPILVESGYWRTRARMRGNILLPLFSKNVESWEIFWGRENVKNEGLLFELRVMGQRKDALRARMFQNPLSSHIRANEVVKNN